MPRCNVSIDSRQAASKPVSGDLYRNPFNDPCSDESRRLARVDAALDALNHLAEPQDANRWINRIMNGWPHGYGYDSVNSLETVVRAFAAFDAEIRMYNRELAGAGRRRERSL